MADMSNWSVLSDVDCPACLSHIMDEEAARLDVIAVSAVQDKIPVTVRAAHYATLYHLQDHPGVAAG